MLREEDSGQWSMGAGKLEEQVAWEASCDARARIWSGTDLNAGFSAATFWLCDLSQAL